MILLANQYVGPLVLGGFAALIVAVVVIQKWRERVRREELAAFAPSIGMDFVPGDDHALYAQLQRLPLFEHGRAKRAYNVMKGTSHGRAVEVFDYHYKTGAGNHSHHHTQTVAHVRFEGAALPKFWMRPHHFLDKVAALVGLRDIDFPDDEAFSRSWHLKAQDEEATRRVFTPRVRSGFDPTRPISVECVDRSVIVYRRDRSAKQDEIRALLEDAFRVTELLTRDGTRAGS